MAWIVAGTAWASAPQATTSAKQAIPSSASFKAILESLSMSYLPATFFATQSVADMVYFVPFSARVSVAICVQLSAISAKGVLIFIPENCDARFFASLRGSFASSMPQ